MRDNTPKATPMETAQAGGSMSRTRFALSLAELALTMLVAVAFFTPSPTRDAWVWLIWGYPLLWVARVIVRQPVGFSHPLVLAGMSFLVVCMVNLVVAPYPSRGAILLYRPVFGLALMVMLIGWALRGDARRGLAGLAVAMGGLVALAALTATQWGNKSAAFASVIAALPRTDDWALWAGGFNPNEIAGAIAWLLPLSVGLGVRAPLSRPMRAALLLAAAGMGLALVLGQSLSGLVGAGVGVVLCALPMRWVRPALVLVMVGVLAGHLLIYLAPVQAADLLAQASGRSSVTSIEHRGVMWERAVAMLNDHPTTGVGLAMYRQLRDEYPTPGFEQALVPHPHNAVLQFATDLGWVGVGQWLLQAVLMGFALWLGWRVPALRGWVIALGAGFAAHSVYGLTDAIPVWDRLAFIGWGVLGAAAAVSVMATRSGATDTPASG